MNAQALYDPAQALLDDLAVVTGMAPVTAPMAPAPALMNGADALLRSLQALAARQEQRLHFDERLLTERAALRGLRARGRISCSGVSRLMRAGDDWVAVSLPRADDWDMLPAWLGLEPGVSSWRSIERAVEPRRAVDVVGSGQRLGIATAVADIRRNRRDAQWRSRGASAGRGPILRRMQRGGARSIVAPLVIDCSSLWAGPLCGHLLQQAGARVIKVESTSRPDGARQGSRAFFDLLNAGKETILLDFRNSDDIARLRLLMLKADVVIESSRPRAFAQLGLTPKTLFPERPCLTWVSITAYGRTGPWRQRVGFGDDAAAGGGLLAFNAAGSPAFVGDAIADPLTGIAAASGALASLCAGGGFLVDAALRETAAFAASASPRALIDSRPDAPPQARPVRERAGEMGSDTARILEEFAL